MSDQEYNAIEWTSVAHANYGTHSETVYQAEFGNYFLYRNGKKYQIEEKGTDQKNWLTESEFRQQLNRIWLEDKMKNIDPNDVLNTKSYS